MNALRYCLLLHLAWLAGPLCCALGESPPAATKPSPAADELHVRLRVVDGKSGKPITDASFFRTLSHSDDDGPVWGPYPPYPIPGGETRYQRDEEWGFIPLTRLKIIAPGYRAVVSRVFNRGENAQLDVKMYLDTLVEGVVLDAKGNAVAGADVAVGTSWDNASVQDGTFRMETAHKAGTRAKVKTDDQGRFRVPYEADPAQIIAVHASGIGHVAFPQAADGAAAPRQTIRLTPWARVDGTVRHDGAPVVGARYHIRSGSEYAYCYSDVVTDAGGRFVASKVAPGTVGFSRWSGDPDAEGNASISGVEGNFSIEAGGSKHLSLGTPGQTVKGRLKVPAGSTDWKNVSVNIHPVAPHIGMRGDGEMWKAWGAFAKTPEGGDYFHYNVPVDASGAFQLESLPAAEYQVIASGSLDATNTQLVSAGSGVDISPFEEKRKSVIDLGTLTVTVTPNESRPAKQGPVQRKPRASKSASGKTTETQPTLPPRRPAPKPAPVAWPKKLVGYVRDEAGRPLAAVPLRLEVTAVHEHPQGRWDEVVHTAKVTSAANGRYEVDATKFPVIEAPPFVIQISGQAPGRATNRTWQWHGPPATPVSESFLDLTLPPGRVIRGRCVDPAGKPVAGAVVRCLGNMNADVYTDPVTTDGNGRFELAAAQVGTVDVWIINPHWAPVRVTVKDRDVALGDIRLPQGTALEGTLVDTSANPVAGAVVALESTDHGSIDGQLFFASLAAKTDKSGHYHLPPAKGEYKLQVKYSAKSDGQLEERYLVTDVPSPLVPPQWITFDGNPKKLPLRAVRTAKLSGAVRWSDLKPAARCEMQALYSSSDYKHLAELGRVQTDKDGYYELVVPVSLENVTICGMGRSDAQGRPGKLSLHPDVKREDKRTDQLELERITGDIPNIDWILIPAK